MCALAGVRDFTWRTRFRTAFFANKRATSLPGDDEMDSVLKFGATPGPGLCVTFK